MCCFLSDTAKRLHSNGDGVHKNCPRFIQYQEFVLHTSRHSIREREKKGKSNYVYSLVAICDGKCPTMYVGGSSRLPLLSTYFDTKL